jgi:protein-tyrosine phosphatase
MEDAVKLIAMEAQGGTEAMIATPHFIESVDYPRLRDLAEKVAEVNAALREAGVSTVIHPGGEIYPNFALFGAMKEGASVTLGGKGTHMLVDIPMGALPHDFDSFLYEVQVRGITPIIAHPERGAEFQEDPERLRPYLERGIALQVNARSISGRYGPRAGDIARYILDRRWAHFLSSDAHRPGERPILAAARDELATSLDADYLRLITRESAACVLRGEELPALPEAPPIPEKKSGWLSRLLRK